MLGGFHEKFLELPAEVLLTSMETHQKSFGLTYMFITHDLSVVEHISTRVAVMYLVQDLETSMATQQELIAVKEREISSIQLEKQNPRCPLISRNMSLSIRMSRTH